MIIVACASLCHRLKPVRLQVNSHKSLFCQFKKRMFFKVILKDSDFCTTGSKPMGDSSPPLMVNNGSFPIFKLCCWILTVFTQSLWRCLAESLGRAPRIPLCLKYVSGSSLAGRTQWWQSVQSTRNGHVPRRNNSGRGRGTRENGGWNTLIPAMKQDDFIQN